MTLSAVMTFLREQGQTHLVRGLAGLSLEKQEAFLRQVELYMPFFAEQKRLLISPSSPCKANPYTAVEWYQETEYQKQGEKALQKGKVGCLILAGGQGSRLGFDGPKGMMSVTPVTNKSLFQLFAERVQATRTKAQCDLPLGIMTSELNHEQTVLFFEEHCYFGLSPSTVSFFKQEQLPLIDAQGNWLLRAPGQLAEGPDGNGHALHLFWKSGLGQQWKEQGVEYLNLIFVDNALADPFDPAFIGFAMQRELDIALKAVARHSPDEAMGVVTEIEGKMRVIEYSELPSDLESFTLSSTGMLCVRLSFVETLSACSLTPPLHLAWKMADIWDPDGSELQPVKQRVGKCERFIFDLLAFTCSSAAFVCAREQVYAPLKNASGEKSLETVQKALLAFDPLFH